MGMLDHFRKRGWQSESFYTAGKTIKILFSTCPKNFQKLNFLILGAVCFGLAIILGITSLPSVTDVLTWKEFAFVQSKMGWLCLVFGTAHDLLLGWNYILEVECGFFLKGTMVRISTGETRWFGNSQRINENSAAVCVSANIPIRGVEEYQRKCASLYFILLHSVFVIFQLVQFC